MGRSYGGSGAGVSEGPEYLNFIAADRNVGSTDTMTNNNFHLATTSDYPTASLDDWNAGSYVHFINSPFENGSFGRGCLEMELPADAGVHLQGSDAWGYNDGTQVVTIEPGRTCEHYIFATTINSTADSLGGQEGADAICEARGNSGDSVTVTLRRSWRALLSSPEDAVLRVDYHYGVLLNLAGTRSDIVVRSPRLWPWGGVSQINLLATVAYEETGASTVASMAYTGSNIYGKATGNNCSQWQSSVGTFSGGLVNAFDDNFLDDTTDDCSRSGFALLCVSE